MDILNKIIRIYIKSLETGASLRVMFRAGKTGRKPPVVFLQNVPSCFSLLQLFFLRAPLASNVAFVLSLFVPHLSLSWCLGKALLRPCGICCVITCIYTTENNVELCFEAAYSYAHILIRLFD